ncbi:MAG: phytanoyl-CoA dioxygenase family protein [Myxococcota bacterium]
MEPYDRDALDRDGFVVVPGVLDPDTVDRLRAAFDGPVVVAEPTGTQHVELGPDTPHLDAWTALADHPVLVPAAHQLLGDVATGVRVHGRNPRPGFGQQGLHADAPLRGPDDPVFGLTSLWMLDPFTVDNGATRVVPGSHRPLRPLPKHLAQPNARHPHEVVVTGPAGAVLLFSAHLWHSGRENRSTGPRRTVQLVVRPASGLDPDAGQPTPR